MALSVDTNFWLLELEIVFPVVDASEGPTSRGKEREILRTKLSRGQLWHPKFSYFKNIRKVVIEQEENVYRLLDCCAAFPAWFTTASYLLILLRASWVLRSLGVSPLNTLPYVSPWEILKVRGRSQWNWCLEVREW